MKMLAKTEGAQKSLGIVSGKSHRPDQHQNPSNRRSIPFPVQLHLHATKEWALTLLVKWGSPTMSSSHQQQRADFSLPIPRHRLRRRPFGGKKARGGQKAEGGNRCSAAP